MLFDSSTNHGFPHLGLPPSTLQNEFSYPCGSVWDFYRYQETHISCFSVLLKIKGPFMECYSAMYFPGLKIFFHFSITCSLLELGRKTVSLQSKRSHSFKKVPAPVVLHDASKALQIGPAQSSQQPGINALT